MAVGENYHGREMGDLLCNATIAKVKQLGATKVELHSNRNTSVICSENTFKLRFIQVYLTPVIYRRANIKIEIDLI